MKLKDLKIGTQLKIGFGIIIVLILILGAISWRQSNKIAEQTTNLYNHPLTVRRSLGELRADILYIRLGMKEMTLANDNKKTAEILGVIDNYEADVFKQFDVLNDRYLGSKTEIEHAYDDFITWNAIRDETIRLRYDGKTKEATARSTTGGVEVNQAEKLLEHILTFDEFARNKGDQFMQSAIVLDNSLNRQLGFMVLGIFGITFLIVFILMNNIRRPLADLTDATKRFKEGNMDAQSSYTSNNEFGVLSSSFNELAKTVKTELTLNKQSNKLAEVMLKEEDANRFCHALLSNLLEETESQVGAVYLLNDEKTEFEYFESIGMNTTDHKSFSAVHFEGEFGVALSTKKLQHIADIPKDSRFTFSTVSGKFIPREIITIPIITGSETVAILSLASINSFSKNSLRLLGTILSTLSARMDGILSYRKVIDFSQQLESQTEELQEQAEELQQTSDELQEQNVELELQQKEVKNANRLKSEFLSNMSHELRTPLNSILALTHVLADQTSDKLNKEELGYLEIVNRNGKLLLTLINDILDLSKIEAGQMDINPSTFSLVESVNEIADQLKPMAVDNGNVLKINFAKDMPNITTDELLVNRIIQNIASNAVKFTENGTVSITGKSSKTQISIIIKDTGIGIPAESLDNIFDEFRQLDGSTTRRFEGTGLGLAIAKRSAVLLGGDVKVESKENEGSIFTIILPIDIPKVDINVFERNIITPLHLGKKDEYRLLIVEDQEAIRMQLATLLKQKGIKFDIAIDGSEAIEYCKKTIPDGIILDLMMPDIDGFQVLESIRTRPETKKIPVLILTAKDLNKRDLNRLSTNNIQQLVQKGDIDAGKFITKIKLLLGLEEKPVDKAKEQQIITKPKKIKKRTTTEGDKPKILIVEDNPDNMISLKAVLQGEYTTLEATDGMMGLEMIKKYKPELVLLDIMLPKLDGMSIIKKVQEDKSIKGISIIAITAKAMKGDKEKLLKAGFDGYMSKPINPKELIEKIKILINA